MRKETSFSSLLAGLLAGLPAGLLYHVHKAVESGMAPCTSAEASIEEITNTAWDKSCYST